MIICYINCDNAEIEEKVSSIEFDQVDSPYSGKSIEITCKRAVDSKHYEPDCTFDNKFYLYPEQVRYIRD